MERDTILLIHSIVGVLIFVSGLLQLFMKKGGSLHIKIGKLYMYGWVVLIISGAYLGGLLITIIGIFGYYFALTGSRMGKLKTNPLTIIDKGIYIVGSVIALSMLYYAVSLYLRNQNSFAIIFAVFGSIFLTTTVKDIFKYVLRKPLTKDQFGNLDWYFEHFKRMIISFIAATTAFTSIQDVFGNNTVNFLAPTVIGTVAIFIVTKNYKKKLIK